MSLDLLVKVLLTVEPISLVTSSSKIAVVSSAISRSSYNPPAYTAVPSILHLWPLDPPCDKFTGSSLMLLAAGWEELALCNYWLSREHTYVLCPGSQLAANTEVMYISIRLLARKPWVLAGNYLCCVWHPDRADSIYMQTFPQGLLRDGFEGIHHKNIISMLTRRLHKCWKITLILWWWVN